MNLCKSSRKDCLTERELKAIAAINFLFLNPDTIPLKKENGFSYYSIPLILDGRHNPKHFASLKPKSEVQASGTIPKNIIARNAKNPIQKDLNKSTLFE